MSEAPERIWACVSKNTKSGVVTMLGDATFHVDGWQEYVRAVRIEELESKLAKATEAMTKAHAEMRAHGWHLAPGSDFDGDGSQEIAVSEIEAEFSDLIAELTADRAKDATTAA